MNEFFNLSVGIKRQTKANTNYILHPSENSSKKNEIGWLAGWLVGWLVGWLAG